MVNTAPWNLKSSYGCIDKPPGIQLQPVAFKWIQCPHRKGSWSMVSLEGIFGEWLWNMSNAKLRWAVLVEPIVAYVKLEHTHSPQIPSYLIQPATTWACHQAVVTELPHGSVTPCLLSICQNTAHKSMLKNHDKMHTSSLWTHRCLQVVQSLWPMLRGCGTADVEGRCVKNDPYWRLPVPALASEADTFTQLSWHDKVWNARSLQLLPCRLCTFLPFLLLLLLSLGLCYLLLGCTTRLLLRRWSLWFGTTLGFWTSLRLWWGFGSGFALGLCTKLHTRGISRRRLDTRAFGRWFKKLCCLWLFWFRLLSRPARPTLWFQCLGCLDLFLFFFSNTFWASSAFFSLQTDNFALVVH